MIPQYILYGFGGVIGFALVNFLVLGTYTLLNLPWMNDLKAIGTDWIEFMRRGIPIPSDPPKFQERFPGQTLPLFLEYRPKTSTFAAVIRSTSLDT